MKPVSEGRRAMATTTRTRSYQEVGDQCVELRDVGWKGYATLLRLRGERRRPRIIYLDGDVLLVTTSFPHERLAKRLGILVQEIVVGLDIPCVPAGETTLRRRKKEAGVEGDETFYLANEARIRGKDDIHLRNDPPPDLAIEAVYTHAASTAVAIYRRFGVPEVWVCDEDELRILVLQPNRRYARAEASAAFPFLTAAEIFEWMRRPQTVSETEWMKDVRRWVRETLAPRRGAGR
jgi:Uma2 family endonuclease